MAESNLFQGGQTAMICQLCEETTKTKWKCLTCEFFMCDNCCKIHKKVKSTGDHDIVLIKDIQKDSTNIDFSNLKCTNHGEHTCCLYCVDCTVVVCPLCIASCHNKHTMEEISKGYKLSIQKLTERSSKLDQECKDLEQDALTLKSARSTEKNKYNTEKQSILDQEKAIKDAVDQHTHKLLTDLDEEWESVDKSITLKENKTCNRIHQSQDKKHSINLILNSHNINDVFETVLLQESTHEVSPINIKTLKSFVKGEITLTKIEAIHGKFADGDGEKFKFEVEEIYQYTTNELSGVRKVVFTDTCVWISDNYKSVLENITLSQGRIHTNKTYKIGVEDMAVMPNGDLLLATGYSELRIIPNSTRQIKVSQFDIGRDIDDYQFSCAVHVTKSGKIIVGAYKTINRKRKVYIHVFNENGIKERIYSADKDNRQLFTKPHRIITDSCNNIYIIDLVTVNEGRVVMLEQWGGVRGIYTGHNVRSTMKPTDLVITPSDRVILADDLNNALHVLNNEGQCIHYQNTMEMGIKQLHSLAIDNQGFLCIGCDTQDKYCNHKIYVVRISVDRM